VRAGAGLPGLQPENQTIQRRIHFQLGLLAVNERLVGRDFRGGGGDPGSGLGPGGF
jgi:hypothetical protein